MVERARLTTNAVRQILLKRAAKAGDPQQRRRRRPGILSRPGAGRTGIEPLVMIENIIVQSKTASRPVLELQPQDLTRGRIDTLSAQRSGNTNLSEVADIT